MSAVNPLKTGGQKCQVFFFPPEGNQYFLDPVHCAKTAMIQLIQLALQEKQNACNSELDLY